MDPRNIFIFIALYYYIFDNTYTHIIEYCGHIIFPLYFSLDLVFYELTVDKKIHHILGLLLCCILYTNRNNFKDEMYSITNFQLSTEISTIFLMIKEDLDRFFSKTSAIYMVNDCMFAIAFMYYRIYNFYNMQDIIIQTGFKLPSSYGYFISIFGLFYLNLYWSVLILKKIFKTCLLTTKYNKKIYCRLICSCTNLIYLPMLFHHVFYDYNEEYILFYVANIALSMSSHIYHYSCYKHIKKYKGEDIFSNNIFYKYEIDIFMCNLNNYILATCMLKDNMQYLKVITSVCVITFIIHMLSMVVMVNSSYVKIYNDMLMLTNITVCYFIYYLVLINDADNAFNVWFSNTLSGVYLLSLINIIKPFYNLNHMLIHLVSWYMLKSTYNFISN